MKLASQIPSVEDSPSKELIFSVLDAWNGYHSIGLMEEAEKYFGFSTEWGTYTYKVAPQGYLGSGDYYTKKMDEVMDKMRGHYPDVFSNPCDPANEQSRSWVRCIDDTVLWASSLTSCLTQTFYFIQECAAEGVVFNEKKNPIRL